MLQITPSFPLGAFSHWAHTEPDINEHKYFQKAAFSEVFPLKQRAASYYSANEHTRTHNSLPRSTHSKSRPSSGMYAQSPEHQPVLPGTAWGQHGHVPHLPPLLIPSLFLLLLLPMRACMRGRSRFTALASGKNSFIQRSRTTLI